MTIRSRPATDEYRDGWDRVFGRQPHHEPTPEQVEHRSGWNPVALSPHDAEDHPEAD